MADLVKIFIPDEEYIWLKAEIIHNDILRNQVEVRITDEIFDHGACKSGTRILPISNRDGEISMPLQNMANPITGIEDMCSLNYLHEPAILDNLRVRFNSFLPYTNVGEICIAVNPYCRLDIYKDDLKRKYMHQTRYELPPHVFSTSAYAFKTLRLKNKSQSILVSGESGAGKTETVKILMDHLAFISGHHNDSSVEKMLQAHPLLESFGNAKTIRNDNSSRFGKFMQLQFDAHTVLAGSKCDTYLLEKTRVVSQNERERSYHIFYQILAAPEGIKEMLFLSGLTSVDFNYTSRGDNTTTSIEGKTDGEHFSFTMNALKLLGMTSDRINQILQILSGLLFLGQIFYVPSINGNSDSSAIDSKYQKYCDICCELLGLDPFLFATKTTARAIDAGGSEVLVPLTVDQAIDVRDALAKEVYSRLFQWLVASINNSSSINSACKTIALLDIFGFESFDVNRFEQLCINYANEKLQQKFTRDVFKGVQEEYRDEGLVWESISFKDNSEVLDLIEGKLGVIACLNEECIKPRGSDITFISKLKGSTSNGTITTPASIYFDPRKREEFAIAHYAAVVSYNVMGFVERNKDAIPGNISQLLASSNNTLLKGFFDTQDSSSSLTASTVFPSTLYGSGGGDSNVKSRSGSQIMSSSFMRAETVTTKFRSQLSMLVESIDNTDVQYVRCIKPNDSKSNKIFTRKMVVEQLRCAGIIEAIRISRSAYPNRMSFLDFSKRFGKLLPAKLPKKSHSNNGDGNSLRLICKDVLAGLSLSSNGIKKSENKYELGKTKVYFSRGLLEHLERRRGEIFHSFALTIQKDLRMLCLRRKYLHIRKSFMVLQGYCRGKRLRKRMSYLLTSILILQSHCRRRIARRLTSNLREALQVKASAAAAAATVAAESVVVDSTKNIRKSKIEQYCASLLLVLWMRSRLQRFRFLRVKDALRRADSAVSSSIGVSPPGRRPRSLRAIFLRESLRESPFRSGHRDRNVCGSSSPDSLLESIRANAALLDNVPQLEALKQKSDDLLLAEAALREKEKLVQLQDLEIQRLQSKLKDITIKHTISENEFQIDGNSFELTEPLRTLQLSYEILQTTHTIHIAKSQELTETNNLLNQELEDLKFAYEIKIKDLTSTYDDTILKSQETMRERETRLSELTTELQAVRSKTGNFVNQLRDLLKIRDQEISQLMEAKEQQYQELLQSQGEVTVLEEYLERLRETMKSKSRQHDTILKAQLKDAEEHMAARMSDMETIMRTEAEEAEKELHSEKLKYEELRKICDELNKQVIECRHLVEKLTANNNRLELESEVKEKSFEREKANIVSCYEATVHTLQGTGKHMESRLAELTHELQLMRNSFTELQSSTHHERIRVEEAHKDEVGRLKELVKQSDSMLSRQDQLLRDSSNKMITLNATVKEAKRNIAMLESSLNLRNSMIKSREINLEEKNKLLQDLEEQLSRQDLHRIELTENCQTLRMQLNDAVVKHTDTLRQLEREKAARVKLEEINENMSSLLNVKLDTARSELLLEKQQFEKKIRQTASELETIKKKHNEEMNKMKIQLQHEIDLKDKEILQLQVLNSEERNNERNEVAMEYYINLLHHLEIKSTDCLQQEREINNTFTKKYENLTLLENSPIRNTSLHQSDGHTIINNHMSTSVMILPGNILPVTVNNNTIFTITIHNIITNYITALQEKNDILFLFDTILATQQSEQNNKESNQIEDFPNDYIQSDHDDKNNILTLKNKIKNIFRNYCHDIYSESSNSNRNNNNSISHNNHNQWSESIDNENSEIFQLIDMLDKIERFIIGRRLETQTEMFNIPDTLPMVMKQHQNQVKDDSRVSRELPWNSNSRRTDQTNYCGFCHKIGTMSPLKDFSGSISKKKKKKTQLIPRLHSLLKIKDFLPLGDFEDYTTTTTSSSSSSSSTSDEEYNSNNNDDDTHGRNMKEICNNHSKRSQSPDPMALLSSPSVSSENGTGTTTSSESSLDYSTSGEKEKETEKKKKSLSRGGVKSQSRNVDQNEPIDFHSRYYELQNHHERMEETFHSIISRMSPNMKRRYIQLLKSQSMSAVCQRMKDLGYDVTSLQNLRHLQDFNTTSDKNKDGDKIRVQTHGCVTTEPLTSLSVNIGFQNTLDIDDSIKLPPPPIVTNHLASWRSISCTALLFLVPSYRHNYFEVKDHLLEEGISIIESFPSIELQPLVNYNNPEIGDTVGNTRYIDSLLSSLENSSADEDEDELDDVNDDNIWLNTLSTIHKNSIKNSNNKHNQENIVQEKKLKSFETKLRLNAYLAKLKTLRRMLPEKSLRFMMARKGWSEDQILTLLSTNFDSLPFNLC